MSGSEKEGKWKKNERRKRKEENMRKWGKKDGECVVEFVGKRSGKEVEREKMGSWLFVGVGGGKTEKKNGKTKGKRKKEKKGEEMRGGCLHEWGNGGRWERERRETKKEKKEKRKEKEEMKKKKKKSKI